MEASQPGRFLCRGRSYDYSLILIYVTIYLYI